jgi:hypothetical protein
MASEHWARIRELSDRPTERYPLGLRTAVLERAAILHFDAGLSWEDADARALDAERPKQISLF